MASANVLTITGENFEKEVLQSKVPVLLDFWAPWCGPCRMIAPAVDEIADETAGQAVVGKVNVDDEQDLAVKFRINAIPALLFFKDGQLVEQLKGQASKSAMLTKLNSLK